jgi:ribonuclease P protein component
VPAAVWRVRDAATFRALRRRGKRARGGGLSVTWLPGPDDGTPPRVAYAIGRSVGGAVVRNRLRRRLRAIVTDLAPDLRPGTYLIGADPSVAAFEHGDLRRTLCTVLSDLPG